LTEQHDESIVLSDNGCYAYRDPAYKFAHFLIFIANAYVYGVCKVFRVFHNKHLIDPSHTRYCHCVYLAWQ